MKRRFAIAVVITFTFLTVAGPSSSLSSSLAGQAAKKGATQSKGKVGKVHAEKGRGGGTDENIKNDTRTNDPSKPAPAPPDKGGERAKGQSSCAVVVDNRTGFYVDIYVDGSFRGTVGPWGDAYCYTGAGSTRLYGVATFSDGSRLTWGPSTVTCYGRYTWQLYN